MNRHQNMIPPLLFVGRVQLNFCFKAETSCNVLHTDQNNLDNFKINTKFC